MLKFIIYSLTLFFIFLCSITLYTFNIKTINWYVPEDRPFILLNKNIKSLLEQDAISINECNKEANIYTCMINNKEKSILIDDNLYNPTIKIQITGANINKDLYCFDYSYKKESFPNSNIIYSDITKISSINSNKWYENIKEITDNTYCFLTNEDAEKGKIEKENEIKTTIQYLIKKEKEKFLEKYVFITGVILIILLCIFCLHEFFKGIRETELYKKLKEKNLIIILDISISITILFGIYILIRNIS